MALTTWQIFSIFSGFWGFVGLILPWFIPKIPSRGVIQCMLVETAFCCYLFWLCTFLMQLRPLIGPVITNRSLLVMKHEWESQYESDSLETSNETTDYG